MDGVLLIIAVSGIIISVATLLGRKTIIAFVKRLFSPWTRRGGYLRRHHEKSLKPYMEEDGSFAVSDLMFFGYSLDQVVTTMGDQLRRTADKEGRQVRLLLVDKEDHAVVRTVAEYTRSKTASELERFESAVADDRLEEAGVEIRRGGSPGSLSGWTLKTLGGKEAMHISVTFFGLGPNTELRPCFDLERGDELYSYIAGSLKELWDNAQRRTRIWKGN